MAKEQKRTPARKTPAGKTGPAAGNRPHAARKETDDRLALLKGKLVSGRVYPEFFEIRPDESVLNIGCGWGPQAVVYSGKYKEMVGVDINARRLEKSKKALREYGIKNYLTICANVEDIPIRGREFDKAIAIDIIEHVQDPRRVCLEANRLLKDGGELLITFPAMHDKFLEIISKVWRSASGKGKKTRSQAWNPDEHNQEHTLDAWIRMVEDCGFIYKKSRGSTLFPPLHLYGVPRFWFSNNLIHAIDKSLCETPPLAKYSQALICVFTKKRASGTRKSG